MIVVPKLLRAFIVESNKIEGITRDPTRAELTAAEVFLALDRVTVDALVEYVRIIARAPLRNQPGMDVVVGRHRPPPGGPAIPLALQAIVDIANDANGVSAYMLHHQYETLHPFMDGNGRSGRLLWAWCMNGDLHLGFLHQWYYQSLRYGR